MSQLSVTVLTLPGPCMCAGRSDDGPVSRTRFLHAPSKSSCKSSPTFVEYHTYPLGPCFYPLTESPPHVLLRFPLLGSPFHCNNRYQTTTIFLLPTTTATTVMRNQRRRQHSLEQPQSTTASHRGSSARDHRSADVPAHAPSARGDTFAAFVDTTASTKNINDALDRTPRQRQRRTLPKLRECGWRHGKQEVTARPGCKG